MDVKTTQVERVTNSPFMVTDCLGKLFMRINIAKQRA